MRVLLLMVASCYIVVVSWYLCSGGILDACVCLFAYRSNISLTHQMTLRYHFIRFLGLVNYKISGIK